MARVLDWQLTDAQKDAQMPYLPTAIQAAPGRLDALEAADVVIDGRLDAAELELVAQDGRLDAVEIVAAAAIPKSLATGAEQALYATGVATWASATLTAFARGLWAAVDAAALRLAIGLSNVDNTSDVNKPVSTLQAAADALRVLKAGDTMTGTLALSNGANLELSGADALGEGNIILKAVASAAFDTNLVLTDATSRTMGYICGATAAFAGAYGPFFGLRGNTYAAYANQRGNIFLYGGKPAGPGATEGRVILGTNDTERLEVTYGGDVKIKTGALYVNQNVLVLPKTQNYGIMVDTTTPTYGWRDLLGQIIVKGVGANDPDWAVFRDTTRLYRFTNGLMREVWNIYHIPHDYVMGSDLYIHVHWKQSTVDTGGPAGVPGSVKWYFDISYASGHGTPGGAADPFNAIITQSVVQQGSTTQYGHMIAEVQFTNAAGDATHIARTRIAPDGILNIRLYRDSADVADTLDQDPFVAMSDVHYQSTNIGTKQKAPPFWT